MLATVNPYKWSQIIFEQTANIVHNEASHLLVNCRGTWDKMTSGAS